MKRNVGGIRHWIALITFSSVGAALAAQILPPAVSLPSSITVSPIDSTITDLNQSLQFTAQSDTGDPFPLPSVGARQVGSGARSCALLSDGTVHCWLNDQYYPTLGPLPVPGLSGVTAIAVGNTHMCALLADTTVQCWGDNFFGQLGDGTTTTRYTPAAVTDSTGAPLINVTAIAAGTYHTCAVLSDTTAKCWGDNGYSGQASGQLGDPTSVGSFKTHPVAVSGLTGATAISAGAGHTCALLINTTVQCWGLNVSGELGDPTLIGSSRARPAPVFALAGVAAISASGFHFTCASLVDGTVKCWGNNQSGQLGNGTRTNSSVPVQVSGISTARGVAIGEAHACAPLADTTVTCWGSNDYGQLGDGTTTSSSVPVLVSGLDTVAGVAPGILHTCALLNGGTVQCWGFNQNGQLGTGFTLPSFRSTPIATLPLGRVAWTSSDPGVAFMDAYNGFAYSVAPGPVTITATYGPLSASTALTVGHFAPAITVPADITVSEIFPGAGVRQVGFTVTATGSPTPTVTCTIAGPITISPWTPTFFSYPFPLGSTPVACTATNSVGSDTKSFTVAVVRIAQLPTLSVGDVTVREGNSGSTSADFSVTLSAASAVPVSVLFETHDGTAVAGVDYTSTSRTVTFASGEIAKIVSVPVIGDMTVEGDTTSAPNETFFGVLSNPTDATIARAQGVGTILDDDGWRFRVTPTSGAAGDLVQATSLTPCAIPSGAGQWTVSLTFLNAGVVTFLSSTPVRPDGAWTVSARIPTTVTKYGGIPANPQASLLARCYDARGDRLVARAYEPVPFTIQPATFTITPNSGPAGAYVLARSVTPCPKPTVGTNGIWNVYITWRGEFLGQASVQPDGSWSLPVRIPLEAVTYSAPASPNNVDAKCGGGWAISGVVTAGPVQYYAGQPYPVAGGRFAMTPTHGPVGTVVQATSIDPCPQPSQPGGRWAVTLRFSDPSPLGTGFFTAGTLPARADGSWMIVARVPFLAANSPAVTVVCTTSNTNRPNGETYTYDPVTFNVDSGDFAVTPVSGTVGSTVSATSITPCPTPNGRDVYSSVTLVLKPVFFINTPESFIGQAPIRPDGSWSAAGPIPAMLGGNVVLPGSYAIRATCYYQGPQGGEFYRYPERPFTVTAR